MKKFIVALAAVFALGLVGCPPAEQQGGESPAPQTSPAASPAPQTSPAPQ